MEPPMECDYYTYFMHKKCEYVLYGKYAKNMDILKKNQPIRYACGIFCL